MLKEQHEQTIKRHINFDNLFSPRVGLSSSPSKAGSTTINSYRVTDNEVKALPIIDNTKKFGIKQTFSLNSIKSLNTYNTDQVIEMKNSNALITEPNDLKSSMFSLMSPGSAHNIKLDSVQPSTERSQLTQIITERKRKDIEDDIKQYLIAENESEVDPMGLLEHEILMHGLTQKTMDGSNSLRIFTS